MLLAALSDGDGPSAKEVTRQLIRWGRRRADWWVALVLPGLLLRALIPLGFMPMFGPGVSVQLTLCEGYAPVPSMRMDMPMGVAAQHHSGGGAGSGGHGAPFHPDHSTCPYGASPTFAALTASCAVPASVQASAPLLISAPQVAHFEIAPRAQSPRGPPLKV
jgi:hypothetical protein